MVIKMIVLFGLILLFLVGGEMTLTPSAFLGFPGLPTPVFGVSCIEVPS